VNGSGAVWIKLADKAVLCKHYEGKALYAGLQYLYAEVHREMNEILLWEHGKSNEFHEQKRRKRNASDSEGIQTKRNNKFHEQRRRERNASDSEGIQTKRSNNIWYTEHEVIAAGSDEELLCPLKNTDGNRRRKEDNVIVLTFAHFLGHNRNLARLKYSYTLQTYRRFHSPRVGRYCSRFASLTLMPPVGINRTEISFSECLGLSQSKLRITSQLLVYNFTTVLDDLESLITLTASAEVLELSLKNES
jgi:hypothetical protein